MSLRPSPVLVVPAVIAGALAAYIAMSHKPATAGTDAPTATTAAKATAPEAPLPANHPRVEGMDRAPNPNAMPNGENQKPASIEWKVPDGWKTLPNANPMRLATYGISPGLEATIARAGGPVDANILRWSQQFDGAPDPHRKNVEVNGMHVSIARIDGTYNAGGMGMGPAEKHANWAMLAAIVEAPGAPYFFKMVGPVADIEHAQKAFDSLVFSITPRAAQ